MEAIRKYRPRGESNPVTPEERQRIIQLKAQGLSNRQIAALTGRSNGWIPQIIKGPKVKLFTYDRCPITGLKKERN